MGTLKAGIQRLVLQIRVHKKPDRATRKLALIAVEWSNPATLGALPVGTRIMAAFFQSVTTRTAGFCFVDQVALTGSGKLISMVLMQVGGSNGSTAGGMKTVTVGLLILMAFCVMRGRREIIAFGRKIPKVQVNNAIVICLLVVGMSLLGGMILSATNGVSLGGRTV